MKVQAQTQTTQIKTYKDERVANMLAGKKSKMLGKKFEVEMQDNGEWAVLEVLPEPAALVMDDAAWSITTKDDGQILEADTGAEIVPPVKASRNTTRSRQRTHEVTLTLVGENDKYLTVKNNGKQFKIAKSRSEVVFQNEGAVVLKLTETYFQHRPELAA